ncbi:MAG: protein-disulfide reductase DsbD domain-containing protein [Parvibaculaceae bacterium]
MNRRTALALAAAFLARPRTALAGVNRHFKLRLISGERQGQLWRAGVDIALDKGWKTYWRMPGDAGVPPEFGWDRSVNIADVKIYWPAPARFVDTGGETVGYKNHVLFPLDVTLKDNAAPAKLVLDLVFAVCDDICMPAKAEAELAEGSAVDAAIIADYMAKVPKPVDGASPFRVESARLATDEEKPDLELMLSGSGYEGDLDIFVEGADFAYFRAPRFGSMPNSCRLQIDGLKEPERLKNRPLTLTMVAGDIRLEQRITVG